jgi:hypothetical protein
LTLALRFDDLERSSLLGGGACGTGGMRIGEPRILADAANAVALGSLGSGSSLPESPDPESLDSVWLYERSLLSSSPAPPEAATALSDNSPDCVVVTGDARSESGSGSSGADVAVVNL